MIEVLIDGNAVGDAVEFNINNYNGSFWDFSIRFDSLNFNQIFQKTQMMPFKIIIKYIDHTFIISDAWLEKVDDLKLEFQASNLIDVKDFVIKCKYCSKNPRDVNHDSFIKILESKYNILERLKTKHTSSIYKAEAIEILKGHFPDYYNKIEKLLILL